MSGSGKVLSERSLYMLNTLVASYIREGLPVGSKKLASDAGNSLSPATVRNIMAELEEGGYIRSPHTSAGRIPTDQGYRLFVDSVVTASSVGGNDACDNDIIASIQEQLSSESAPAKLAETASSILSNLTHQAGVVLLPRSELQRFRQVEFLPLSNRRVLAILVLDEHEVQNRIIRTEQDYSEQQLQQAAAYINAHYSGLEVTQAQAALVQSMAADKSLIDDLMQTAIDVASQALATVEQQERDYVVAGQANLLDSQQEDMRRLRELFEAFQQKKDILHLMERCARGDGVQIFIGEESGYEVLDDFSLITAPYQGDQQPIGVLGIIGPTRMDYDRVVPMVDITARLLGAALRG